MCIACGISHAYIDWKPHYHKEKVNPLKDIGKTYPSTIVKQKFNSLPVNISNEKRNFFEVWILPLRRCNLPGFLQAGKVVFSFHLRLQDHWISYRQASWTGSQYFSNWISSVNSYGYCEYKKISRFLRLKKTESVHFNFRKTWFHQTIHQRNRKITTFSFTWFLPSTPILLKDSPSDTTLL